MRRPPSRPRRRWTAPRSKRLPLPIRAAPPPRRRRPRLQHHPAARRRLPPKRRPARPRMHLRSRSNRAPREPARHPAARKRPARCGARPRLRACPTSPAGAPPRFTPRLRYAASRASSGRLSPRSPAPDARAGSSRRTCAATSRIGWPVPAPRRRQGRWPHPLFHPCPPSTTRGSARPRRWRSRGSSAARR